MSFGKFLGCVVSTTFVIAPTLGTTYLALHKDVTLMDSESPNIVLGERKEPNEPTTVTPTEKAVEVKSSSEKSDTEDSQTSQDTTSEDSEPSTESSTQEQAQPVKTEGSEAKEEEEVDEEGEEDSKPKNSSLKLSEPHKKSNITIASPDVIFEALVKSLVKISENAVRAIR